MISSVGTWTWAQRTNGRLGRRDELELLRQGVLARLARLPGPWRRAIVPESGALNLPAPPDTALARTAEERVRELSTPALYGHCLRTWAFADLFAQADDVEHDAELLYLACVLHDLGLTDRYDGTNTNAACFAVEGARAAQSLMLEHDRREDRAQAVAAAISLHLNIGVPARLGAEASLLSKGVMLDVIGRRLERLPRRTVGQVVERWPREGSDDFLLAATKRQAELRPRSRAALLHRLGFAQLVCANPLDRTAAGTSR